MAEPTDQILGNLASNQFDLEEQQRNAWINEIAILKEGLKDITFARVIFEYSIHHFLLEIFFINFGSLSLTTGIILFMIIEWNLLAATSKVKIITKQRRFLASVMGIVTLNTFS